MEKYWHFDCNDDGLSSSVHVMCFMLLLRMFWKYFYRITLDKDSAHSDEIIRVAY